MPPVGHRGGSTYSTFGRDSRCPKVKFEHRNVGGVDSGVWTPDYHLLNRLIAPLQLVLGKA